MMPGATATHRASAPLRRYWRVGGLSGEAPPTQHLGVGGAKEIAPSLHSLGHISALHGRLAPPTTEDENGAGRLLTSDACSAFKPGSQHEAGACQVPLAAVERVTQTLESGTGPWDGLFCHARKRNDRPWQTAVSLRLSAFGACRPGKRPLSVPFGPSRVAGHSRLRLRRGRSDTLAERSGLTSHGRVAQDVGAPGGDLALGETSIRKQHPGHQQRGPKRRG